MGKQPLRYLLASLALCLVTLFDAHAQTRNITTDDFNFNFQPLPMDAPNRVQNTPSYRPFVFCNVPGQADVQCNARDQWFWVGNFADDFRTSFVQEVVNIQGINYFHVIVDQRGQGFGQEFYMRAGGVAGATFGRQQYTDSGGSTCNPRAGATAQEWDDCLRRNNAADPLRRDAVFTGNGTGNPKSVMMRQTLDQPTLGFTQEFLKPFFDKKPIVKQDIRDGMITSEFVADMSEIDYNTDSTPGKITNRMTVNSVGFPDPASATFDMDERINDGTNVSGGRYTWTSDRTSGLGGTYTYHDGTVDPVHTVDWASFRDPAQNQ